MRALDPWGMAGSRRATSVSTTEPVEATRPLHLAEPEDRDDPVSREDAQDAASDLWSLPVDAGGLGACGEDDFVAAWMSAMGGGGSSGNGNGVAVRGAAAGEPPGPCEVRAGGSPAAVPAGGEIPPPSSGRAWTGILVAIGLSVVVGVVSLMVIVQVMGRGGGAAAGPASMAVEDRVVVPGPSAECPTMLVKPQQDGNTSHVPGTCFSVG